MVTKIYECENCGAHGKITVKGDEYQSTDIVYCPVCSSDIFDEDDIEDD